jgi:O-antigen/teichoic acid export membrane protein
MIPKLIRTGRAYWSGEGLGSFLVRSVTGSAAVQAAGMVLAFLVGVQLARGLGVKGYGYYGMAMAVIALATVPSSLGIPKLVTREVAAAQSRNDPAALFGVLRWANRLCSGVAVAIAIAVAAGGIVVYETNSAVLGAAILLGAPMILLNPLIALRGGALRGLHHVVLAQVPGTVVRPLIMCIVLFALFVAGAGFGTPTAMALNSITALCALILVQHWFVARLPEGRPAQLLTNGRAWLASSVPMAISDMLQSMQKQLAVLVLGILTAPAQVGLFRVAISTAAVLVIPITLVNAVSLPMFSRLHTEEDHPRLQKLLTATARIQCAGVSLFSLPLLVATGPLLGLVFGKDYIAAVDTVRIMAAGVIVNSAFGPNAGLLNMTGHERRVTRAVSVALVVTIALVLLLAPDWGSTGAAIGFFGGQICWNALLWIDAGKRLSLDTSVFGLRFLAGRAAEHR